MWTPDAIPDLPKPRSRGQRPRERVWTRLSTAVDAAVMSGVSLVVERALIPSREDIEALKNSAHILLARELVEEPRNFFGFLEEPLAPTSVKTGPAGRRVGGGVVYRRRLEAQYRPFFSEADEGSRDAREIASPIQIEHWVHQAERARGTVIGLHGFAMGRPSLDAVALFATQWYQRGLDVVLVTLPRHGARTPPDARFSGESFAVPHVARLSEAVREAIYEIFVIQHWLRKRSDAPVGLLGLSLGGYLAALAAGLRDDFDFVIPMVPPACIGDLAWRVFRRTRHCRGASPPAIDAAELRACFRVHSPLAHSLQVPRERILIVAGHGDRVVPPEHPTALWEHWGEPAIHWFSGSHIAPFGRDGVVRAVSEHLRSLNIL